MEFPLVKICVCGLWHLGLVTAACAATGFETVAFDFDADAVAAIRGGTLPIFEPGLEELIASGVASGRLRWSSDPADALRDADLAWIAWDTPVDAEDRADVAFVADRIRELFPHLRPGALLLISSQVPVGFSRAILAGCAAATGRDDVRVAYSPENLRLGTAIAAFCEAPRAVVGFDRRDARAVELFARFTPEVLEMSLESAEMAKHALNAFLATSLSFANEIAAVCEATGADAADVARALRSDPRIGSQAYLSAGPGFAGGTLARDVGTLEEVAARAGLALPLLGSIRASNRRNQSWPLRTLRGAVAKDAIVAILGLTYKPGTDTLRRSSAVELAMELAAGGARVRAYDPAVSQLPAELRDAIELRATVDEALAGADAVVVATEWPQFAQLGAARFTSLMRRAVVVDARRVLDRSVREDPGIAYFAIGLGAATV